jgi:hypothetical protein
MSIRRLLSQGRFTKKAYEKARSVRHSKSIRTISEMPFYPFDRIRESRNGNYFAFDVTGSIGMGGVLTHVIRLVKHADQNSLIPIVRCTGALYSIVRGEDWFNNVFTQKNAPEIRGSLKFLSVRSEESYGAFPVPKAMSLADANRLFFKYFDIHPRINSMVDSVLGGIPTRKFDLSLHYRGTDKVFEANEVPFETIDGKISNLQANGMEIANVFLATDSFAFDAFIRERRPEFNFTSMQFSELDRDSVPRHFSSLSPDVKAIEAIGNIKLLGMARFCIRTASYLSAWSKILNPDLKTSTLNFVRDRSILFPEPQILEEECSLPLSLPPTRVSG